MFTKESLSKFFKANKGKNFCISTTIATGKGINGVDYAKFYGRNEWTYSGVDRHDNAQVVKFDDAFLVIRNDVKAEHYQTGVFVRYIPYENINCVSFIEESGRFGATL